jgi:WD40 repeat protein
VIKEFFLLLREGRKGTPAMPTDVQTLFRHLILFLRHRASWVVPFEGSDAVFPPGLWLQEFRNMPLTSSAVFADPIYSNLEDHWSDILSSRGGRIESENGWKQDDDPYGPIPITHKNIQCCAVSVDGKLLVTGASDGTVKVWNIVTGEEQMTFIHVVKAEESHDFHSVSYYDEDYESRSKPSKSGITFVAFSTERNSSHVVSTAHDSQAEPTIKLWSLKTPHASPKIMSGAHKAGSTIVRCELFPPDSRRLMSIGSDYNVVLWEVARCRMIRVIPIQHLDDELTVQLSSSTSNSKKAQEGAKSQGIKRRRQNASGWNRVTGTVGPNGNFAFGSSSIIVMDGRWKELLNKDLNDVVEKERLNHHKLTGVAFSSDGSTVFVSSAIPPDDLQILIVERQAEAEIIMAKSELNTSVGDGHGATENTNYSNSSEVEHEIKRLRNSVIRAWNVETGQLKLAFYVDDYIQTLSLSPDNMFILTAGSRGVITAWNAVTGVREFCREGQPGGIIQLVPYISNNRISKPGRKSNIDEDEAAAYSYTGNACTVSTSRSMMSLQSKPPLQFVSAGLDNTLLLWTLEGEVPDPGLAPVIIGSFSYNAEWLITVGGGTLSATAKPTTLIRLWEIGTATARQKIEINETPRSEVIEAVFLPRDDSTILIGFRNGLVRIYKCKTAEVLREFWADVDMSLSESVLGYKVDWPFSVVGTTVLSYAVHPAGRIIAVAVCGQERTPSYTAVVENPRVLSGSGGSKYSSSTDTRSGDLMLRDLIKVTFWDIEGNPIATSSSFKISLLFNASDSSCVVGPLATTRPSLFRRSSFKLLWNPDGKTLFASDDQQILKEFSVELRGDQIFGSIQATSFWKLSQAPPHLPPHHLQQLTQAEKSDLSSKRNPKVSAATACTAIVVKDTVHLCFAMGDGTIGIRSTNLNGSNESMNWYMGHYSQVQPRGEIVSCAYIPYVPGRCGSSYKSKHTDLPGVVLSGCKNGTIVIQVRDLLFILNL